jgi:integrase
MRASAHSLERIRRRVVEDLMATTAGETPRRAELALTLLKRILRSAEARGRAIDPAVFQVRVARPEEREPRFLTCDEVDEVRSWVPEDVSRIIPVAVLTMLRRGEILGLRDRDIDLERGTISVSTQTRDGRRTRTKTRAGRRTVDVGPTVLKLLREQQLVRAPNAEGLLFPARTGVPFDGNNLMYRVFKPAGRRQSRWHRTFSEPAAILSGIYVEWNSAGVGPAMRKSLQIGYGAYRDRTGDLRLAKPALSQLS